jgi:hydrogenase maturation protease
MPGGTVIIGVGNRDRGDDGIGFVVSQGLRARVAENVRVLEESRDGAAILEAFAGADELILVDAAESGMPPGTIHRIDAGTERIPRDLLRLSSHAFGAAEAIELARALRMLPARATVYGIAGANFSAGAEIHPAVREAAISLIAQIEEQLQGEFRIAV